MAGTWAGLIPIPSTPLLFVMTVADDNGTITATARSPYQAGALMTVESLASTGGSVTFTIPKVGVTFKGTLAANPATAEPMISGTFSQAGSDFPLVLVPSAVGTKDLAGTWLGTLKTPAASYLLGLTLTKDASGALTATMDSPAQQSYALPVHDVTAAGGKLTFTMPALGASYTGTIGPKSITGTFTQGGAAMPLTFARP